MDQDDSSDPREGLGYLSDEEVSELLKEFFDNLTDEELSERPQGLYHPQASDSDSSLFLMLSGNINDSSAEGGLWSEEPRAEKPTKGDPVAGLKWLKERAAQGPYVPPAWLLHFRVYGVKPDLPE